MFINNESDFLYNLFTFTVLIPIALGFTRWRLLTSPARWVVVFLLALLIHELLSILCITIHTRNHFLYYVQTVAVLCSVAGVYSDSVGSGRFAWKIAIGISLLMVIEIIFWVGFNHINSITLTISRLIPAVYAAISLHRLFSSTIFYSLTPKPMLYTHIGFFIIGAFTAINACFKSYFIETSLDLYYLFNNMSALMSAVAFGFFSVGFLQVGSTYKT